MHHGTHVPHYLVKCSQHQFISAVNISKQNSMLSWGKFFNSPKCIFLLTQFCFDNQWQIIVFLRHPVAYPVASEVEVEPNYSQEYQVSQKLIAASKAASEAVTAAALTTFQIPI